MSVACSIQGGSNERQSHTCQATALKERTIADARYTARYFYACQATAIIERISADAR